MVTAPGGYDAVPEIGWLYDQLPLYATRRDVAFYLFEAERTRSHTVIEVGCGTGRVLVPLARAGYRMVGVDASERMLERCRAKLAEEPAELQKRVTLIRGDARDLSGIDVTADLVIAPFRVLQHLTEIADQVLCLAAIARRLKPSGRLAFDVFNPNFAVMTRDRSAEHEDTPEFALPDGRRLRRTARVPHVRWVDQISEIELVYHLTSGDRVSRLAQTFEMRWYLPAELEHLLARAGYVVEGMYGDFDRSELRDDSPEIVVVAAKS